MNENESAPGLTADDEEGTPVAGDVNPEEATQTSDQADPGEAAESPEADEDGEDPVIPAVGDTSDDDDEDGSTTVDADPERIKQALSWVDALSDPSTGPQAFSELKSRLENAGILPKDGEGIPAVESTEGYGLPDQQYVSENERFLAARQATLEKRLAAYEAAEKARQEDANIAAWATKAAAPISQAIQKLAPGFTVTAKMAEKAIRAYPQHRNEPVRAVEAYYAKQIIQAARQTAPQAKGKAPTLAQQGRSEGHAFVPGHEYKFRDALREIEGNN